MTHKICPLCRKILTLIEIEEQDCEDCDWSADEIIETDDFYQEDKEAKNIDWLKNEEDKLIYGYGED